MRASRITRSASPRSSRSTPLNKEALRIAITEIKDIIDNWGTDIKRGVDNDHGRLDTIDSELLRRAGS
jgi:hypothetical protein